MLGSDGKEPDNHCGHHEEDMAVAVVDRVGHELAPLVRHSQPPSENTVISSLNL
jgi:hypothetical protein